MIDRSLAKQPSLKPFDLVVAAKLALHPERSWTLAALAAELFVSASEIHTSTRRARMSKLVKFVERRMQVDRSALLEFVLHGVPYAFPAVEGPVVRGMPTAVSSPAFQDRFVGSDPLPWVWPDADGSVRGPSLCPLHPRVPAACRQDPALYRVLASIDALRAGRAREREAAKVEIEKALA